MDSLIGDTKLDVHYPAFLGVPQDDGDADRLIASMKRAAAKPHRYLLRTQHGTSSGLSVAKFCEAVEVLALMENGVLPAINELGTEVHQWEARKATVPTELVLLTRSLLPRFSFDARGYNLAWQGNQLAELAFVGLEAVEAVTQFAAQFAAALDDHRSHGDDYGDLACTLFKLQPVVALNAFLSKPNPKRHLGFRARFIASHGPVVQCAPEDVLLQWVSEMPETRAALVAREIDIIERKQNQGTSSPLDDGAGHVTLSPLAARLLELAPDKASVLQSFHKHLDPSHWSGSLGQTLAPYLALVQTLVGHADSVVAAWAKEELVVMRRRIDHDREIDVTREQSFE